jgi:hypothetical protein
MLFAALGMTCLRAQPAASTSSTTTSVPITNPTQVADKYREVLARPEFHETQEPSLNSRIEDSLSQWFKTLGTEFGEFKYANRMPAFESLLMTLLVVFSLSTLLYIMVRLTRRRGKAEYQRPQDLPGRKTFRPPEFYDREIQEALTARDWHTAWLAAWRQFLSRLEQRQLVEADRTRTNREYLRQLQEKALPASALALVSGMVEAYDRFIYGRESIDENDWRAFHEQIDEAALMLHFKDKVGLPGARSSS